MAKYKSTKAAAILFRPAGKASRYSLKLQGSLIAGCSPLYDCKAKPAQHISR